MADSADDIRATLEAGRAAAANGLRHIADRIEKMRVDAAADALAWLRKELDRIQREAARVFAGR